MSREVHLRFYEKEKGKFFFSTDSTGTLRVFPCNAFDFVSSFHIKMKTLLKRRNKDEITNATKSVPLQEKEVICKFFNPCGVGTWYVLEGQEEDDDFIFFGLVDLHEKEFGYFSLNELQSLKLPFGLSIERDLHYAVKKVAHYWDK